MNRGRRRVGRSQTVFALFAVVMIAALVLSGLIILLPFGNSNRSPNDGATIRVTPGAEISRLETAVASNPDDVNSMIVLAEVLANSGRLNESYPWFEEAVARKPDDSALRTAFGRALQRGGSWFDAELQFMRAVELDPENDSAAYYLGLLYEGMPEPRVDEALRWYQRAVDIDPGSIIAEQSLARIAELEGAETRVTPTP